MCNEQLNTQIRSGGNKKNSRLERFWLAKHKHTNIPTMMELFSPPAAWFLWTYIPHYRTPGSLFARGWTRPPSKGFIRINKIKEKIIYFYSLSVNYNNRSPAVGNDSQNGINCRRRAAIIYELTNNILMNNSVARLYFIMTRIMLFSYGYARQKLNNRKNCSCFAGHFDGNADQAVRCQVHGSVRQV